MTAAATLVTNLKAQVLALESDLRVRIEQLPEAKERWQAEHRQAVKADRTASPWGTWRDDRITQAAVAWVLTTVFLRFCEDNALLKPVWISGPPERRQEALDGQLSFFREHPDDTDREWLLDAVDYLKRKPATRALVDDHSPLWSISPSGNAITALLDFWRRRDDHGNLIHDFTDADLSTRFLGDLYQDLSDYAKKTFALLQTPEFVEEFILDQTMEPALAERPLDGFTMIDPTCGSGHFLLGAFQRLLDRWDKQAPAMDMQARVQKALDSINGVDLNPFAVSIAKFRLTVAAMQACGLKSLQDAPAFDYHLAAGDSLLHGRIQQEIAFDDYDPDSEMSGFAYASEDLKALKGILEPGRYDVVVGNPPYITVKDSKLNKAYRHLYPTCKGTYALTVPFMERFFQLAKAQLGDQPAGWVGQITSNSFMKREFGSKLIEEFLVKQDLRLVADTSGAYIPGHGTPTVIIVGRHQRSTESTVRAVLGIRGEPGRPDSPAHGQVWSSIVRHLDLPQHDDQWITVTNFARQRLAKHPWSLSGGGAADLTAAIEQQLDRLGMRVKLIGRTCHTGSDEVYFGPFGTWVRLGVSASSVVPLVTGDRVRDWALPYDTEAIFPYDDQLEASLVDVGVARLLWCHRRARSDRREPGGTHAEIGLTWFEWSRWHPERFCIPLGITFAFVATHNHFVLDRGGKVFKQSAPVIKLPEGATEDDHLGLGGVLNSSTACFWLKQNSYPKGGDPMGDDGARVSQQPWSDRYEFTGTTLQDFPLPATVPPTRARLLDQLAQEAASNTPAAVTSRTLPTASTLAQARTAHYDLRGKMVAQQEELDWEVYRLYKLMDDDLTYQGEDLPILALGERAFEIALARKVVNGDTAWFARHGSTPITEIPAQWPEAYRHLVQRRLDLIEFDPNIRLLEKPEHKRRWASEPWEKQQEQALRGWLLDRLEDKKYWFDAHGRPTPRSISQLADQGIHDHDLVSVLALWEGRPDVPVVQSLTKLMTDEAVPFLAAYRLKESGMRKREAWEETWDLQRREDAGEQIDDIPVPPKYTNADFRKTSWWQARGKLDVPKERFILYPDAGRGTGPTLLLGWAGWDHAQQALALATIITEREAEGWQDEPLVPLVAGLAELQPWVEQWHADVDPAYGVSLAVFCREQLAERSRQINKSTEELKAWRPAARQRGRKAAR